MLGTDGDDTLAGANGNSYRFKGFAGNDTLTGADGDDVFIYSDSDLPAGDVLDGGDGFDTISFYTADGTNLFLTLTDAMRTNIEEVLGGDGNELFSGYSLTSDITLSGGAGNDALESGSGNDTLIGGDGNDTLKGNGGDDGMFGGAGDDWFLYWTGQTNAGDFISGGDGFDTVEFHSEAGTARAVTVDTSFSSIERIFGGDGDDSFDASGTTDGIILDSGSGNDVLIGGSGNDTLAGGAGSDVLSGGAGDDTIYYYLPGDTPVGDTIDGGDGYDAIQFYTAAGTNLFLMLNDAMRTNVEQVLGGDGDELFSGYSLTSDIALKGGAGNDVLESGSGNDILVGGDGNDTLKGNGGEDVMLGGAGDDWFLYWSGQTSAGDFVGGGVGFDTVEFHSEAGTVRTETLDFSYFKDIERVLGGDGDDNFDASTVKSGLILDSGNGNDVLVGTAGADTLVGGAGNDILKGNSGYDTLIGGTGDDIFVMQGSGGTWTVTDFVQGQDHIQIVSDTPLDFASVQAQAVQVGDDTHISINGSELILQQIGVANLQASDFIF